MQAAVRAVRPRRLARAGRPQSCSALVSELAAPSLRSLLMDTREPASAAWPMAEHGAPSGSSDQYTRTAAPIRQPPPAAPPTRGRCCLHPRPAGARLRADTRRQRAAGSRAAPPEWPLSFGRRSFPTRRRALRSRSRRAGKRESTSSGLRAEATSTSGTSDQNHGGRNPLKNNATFRV